MLDLLTFVAGPRAVTRSSRTHFVKNSGVMVILKLIKECADLDARTLDNGNSGKASVSPRPSLKRVLNALVAAEGEKFGSKVMKHVLGSQGGMDYLVNHLVVSSSKQSSVDYSRVHEFAGEKHNFSNLKFLIFSGRLLWLGFDLDVVAPLVVKHGGKQMLGRLYTSELVQVGA